MARNASAIKLGFYPAPPEALDYVFGFVKPPSRGNWACLDPCSGEGLALEQIAGILEAKPQNVYAIELDEGRGRQLAERLPEANTLAPASFFGTAISSRIFSAIYCNSPFDHSQSGGRTELDFLKQVTTLLAPKGVLVFVCPESVVSGYYGDTQRHLLTYYDGIHVVKFPEDHRPYNEVAVLAHRMDKFTDPYKRDWRKDALWEEPARPLVIPQGSNPLTFSKSEMTDTELAQAMKASPLRKHLVTPKEIPLPEPPLSLGKGHIALLLAAGHLDGVVRPPGEQPHVVRGSARKEQYVASVETTDNGDKGSKTTTILSERLVLTVRVVDSAGDVRTISSSEKDKADGKTPENASQGVA